MTQPDALDFSWSRPDPAALRQSGVRLVCRYLSHDPSKDLSPAEAAALHTEGIGILPNWESLPGRPLGGAANGREDGLAAAARAEAVGIPHGCTIYYSCDTDTFPNEWPTIAEYYRAAAAATAGRYKVGVYGEADLIEYLHKVGAVESEWQTYAWSGGRVSPEADILQYLNGQTVAGASVDLNRIIHADKLGAWWPANSPLAPKPEGAASKPIRTKEPTGMYEIIRDHQGGAFYAWAPGLWYHIPNRTELQKLSTRSLCINREAVAKDPLGGKFITVTHDGAHVLHKVAMAGGSK